MRDFLATRAVPKPAVLAHSMGNIIVAELAKDELLGADGGDLVSNLILTSAPVKTKRHARWLDRIGIAERDFVPQGQKGNARLTAFYRQAALGKAMDFAGLAVAGRIDGVAVQRIVG